MTSDSGYVVFVVLFVCCAWWSVFVLWLCRFGCAVVICTVCVCCFVVVDALCAFFLCVCAVCL